MTQGQIKPVSLTARDREVEGESEK